MRNFVSIADLMRRRIVDLLAERARSRSGIASRFDGNRSPIFQHSSRPREANRVPTGVGFRERGLSLDLEKIEQPADWLEKMRLLWSRQLDNLERQLRTDESQPAHKRSICP